MKGEVRSYNSRKGFGFIETEDGKKLFVHKTELKDVKRLRHGQKVTFDEGEYNGRPVAVNVNRIKAAPAPTNTVEA